MTAEEILDEHGKIANDGTLPSWRKVYILAAMEEYAQQQVKSVDLADVGGNEVELCENCDKRPVEYCICEDCLRNPNFHSA